jgi:hypothetical protein
MDVNNLTAARAKRLTLKERENIRKLADPNPNWSIAWFDGEESLIAAGLVEVVPFTPREAKKYQGLDQLRKRKLTDLGRQVASELGGE